MDASITTPTLTPLPPGPLLLGVSGGGDSIALLHLLLAQGQANRLHIATYNHNWGPFGPQAVAFVRSLCHTHNLPFHTATGQGKPATNAEATARTERHTWLQATATQLGASIVLAHTQTDLAESFLLRAGKGSGAGGLAAMQPLSTMGGVTYGRPLLNTSRESLRTYLTANGHTWLEDPDNELGGSQRARIRKLLPALAAAGISAHGLAASAQAVAQANAALEAFTTSIPLTNPLPLPTLLNQPEDIALRLLLRLIQTIHPHQILPVRRTKRQSLLARLRTQPQGHATLSGVKFSWKNNQLSYKSQ